MPKRNAKGYVQKGFNIMNFLINNVCNRNCSYCFEGDFTKAAPQWMSLETVRQVLDFFTAEALSRHQILGGEPTLHPQILEIAQLIHKRSERRPGILTNGICDSSLLREILIQTGAFFAFNLNTRDSYTDAEFSALLQNMELLTNYAQDLALTVTIADPTDSFDLLYDLLRQKLNITQVRIAISSPGKDFSNLFPKEFSLEYGRAYLRIVEKCHKLNPRLRFSNECAVNLCLMEAEIYSRLREIEVGHLTTRCNVGNLDILPDLSTHWCFAAEGIPELTIANVLTYPNWWHVQDALNTKKRQLERSLAIECDYTNCNNLNCFGPCVCYNYYRKNKKLMPASTIKGTG
jgi:sulfatase maturation enzyme AslB (radical SAM superfamily)